MNISDLCPGRCRRGLLIALASVGLLQGCGGGGSSGSPSPTPPPAADTTAPTVPGNVVAAALSSSRIDLNWAAATDTGGSGLSGYRIFRDGSTTALATVNAPTTTYADTGLTASTQYSYVVHAFDVAGNQSTASSAASATTQAISTDTTAPTTPTNVVAAALSSSRIDLNWAAATDTGGSGLSGYRIFRDGSTTALATVNAPTTTYADIGLTASTQYSYVVHAFDVAGNQSTASSAASATTQAVSTDTTAPTTPTDVVATASSNARIDLGWTAATDAGGSGLSGYRIFRNGSTTSLATVNAPTTTYADIGLTASTQYSYVVLAFDTAGNQSAASSAVSATTLAAPPAGIAGLDSRPSNATCSAWPRPASGSITLQPFTALSFNSAMALLQAPDDNDSWYVVEQGGTIRRFVGSTATSATTFGTIAVTAGAEMGLLGMAFHPDFPADNRVFVSYTRRVNGRLVSRISSFPATPTALGAPETVLLTVDQPEDNHNGGNIAFGHDGYLYIGLRRRRWPRRCPRQPMATLSA